MQVYLSSARWSSHPKMLQSLTHTYKKLGMITNAMDFTQFANLDKQGYIDEEINWLCSQGFSVERIDLRDYFFKQNELQQKLNTLNAVWITGGNIFVLRQAMKLSNFDIIFEKLVKRKDFLYSGYSAAICILSKNLKPYAFFDTPMDFPYQLIQDVIWDGLGLYDYLLIPHCDFENGTNAYTNCINYCIKNKILFKAFSDGDSFVDDLG